MATNWPGAIDAPHDPVAGESMASGAAGDLAQEITNLNDRTVAIENNLGTTTSTGSFSGFRLISRTVLAATATTITFSSIPQFYENLRVTFLGAMADVASAQLWVRFNGDSAADYDWQYLQYINGSLSGNALASTGALLGIGPPQGTSRAGEFDAIIPGYARTAFRKYGSSKYVSMNGADSAANFQSGTSWFQWRSAAAINSLSIIDAGAGSGFIAGTVFSLYGET